MFANYFLGAVVLFHLQAPEIVYVPSLEYGVADGFSDIVDSIMGDVYKQASMIKRLATHSGQEHYQVDLDY